MANLFSLTHLFELINHMYWEADTGCSDRHWDNFMMRLRYVCENIDTRVDKRPLTYEDYEDVEHQSESLEDN